MSGSDRSVRGVCPACGTALLFLGEGGYLTCSLHDCPDPTAADRLLFNSRAVRPLVDAVSIACGSRLADRDVWLADLAQACGAALDEERPS